METMNATIQSPRGELVLEVCKDGDPASRDWIAVYEESFPPAQRQDIIGIQEMLSNGQMELDETRDQHGHVLCMTLTEVFSSKPALPAFLLACYTAVYPEMRGLGIGSIHRRKLAALLEVEYAGYLGLFSEIESTRDTSVDQAAMTIRKRRKAFFLRLGLKEVSVDYRFPSYIKGEEPLQGELLWLPFKSQSQLDEYDLTAILCRIYIEGYKLSPNDPLIERVISSIRSPKPVS